VRKDEEYPLFDGLGSERTVTNASQTVTGTINYDAFGQTVGTTGSSTNPYMFAATWGYRTDGDAGLMHVGARYYDAQVGRFLTRDTVLSEHPYLYCEHEPVNHLDPSGHAAEHKKGKRKSTHDKHTKPRPGDPEKGDKRRFGPKEKWHKPPPEPEQPPNPQSTPAPEPEPLYRRINWDAVVIGVGAGAIVIGIIFAPEITIPAVAVAL